MTAGTAPGSYVEGLDDYYECNFSCEEGADGDCSLLDWVPVLRNAETPPALVLVCQNPDRAAYGQVAFLYEHNDMFHLASQLPE